MRDVSNTDGLVLVRALRRQRSCCERCDSNIYAHKVAKSGPETRLQRAILKDVTYHRQWHSGEDSQWAGENQDTRAHAHAQTAILRSLRPHTCAIFSGWDLNQYTFGMLYILICQSKLCSVTRCHTRLTLKTLKRLKNNTKPLFIAENKCIRVCSFDKFPSSSVQRHFSHRKWWVVFGTVKWLSRRFLRQVCGVIWVACKNDRCPAELPEDADVAAYDFVTGDLTTQTVFQRFSYSNN